MTKENLIEKAENMMNAPSCCAQLKKVAQEWIDSVGKADEKEKAKIFIDELQNDITPIDELQNDITPIDGLVTFAHSPISEKLFGAEGAKNFAAHADELKASGAKYCDCGACAPGLEILNNKEVIL